ncbi:MAG: CinA family nicotinamide mononucleotide deamidase-related protein [Myxococcales bacterium]|nr:CinA family nicotinamide mononucleotide deamidase-related protein [Myxococcales bacterium]
MTAAIVSIGSELLRGEVPDTNAAWLARRLDELGFEIVEITTVGDEVSQIAQTLRRLAAQAAVVMVTGGLGPTSDDRTAEAAASVLGVGLHQDPVALTKIRRKLGALGRAITPSLEAQSEVPETAEVLGNPVGFAPSFLVQLAEAEVIFLPGDPSEMEACFEAQVTRRLLGRAEPRRHRVLLRTYGLPESVVGERLAGLEEQFSGLAIGYRATAPVVEVSLTVRADDVASARAVAEQAASAARAKLGDAYFGEGDESFAAAIGRKLRARGFTLAVAESCTGGLIGAMLTAVPGSSEYLLLDAVTYSNAAKERVLGVSAEILRGHGAVSAECVRAMAEGARRLTGSDLAVSVSGVAGPGGGSAEKPVGLVFFALAAAEGTTVLERRFQGDRARVQLDAAHVALELVRAACRGPVAMNLAGVCG